MDNLKKIIESNKALFTEETLLGGDEKRFFDKLDKDNTIQFKTSITRRKAPVWRATFLSIAAVTLLLLVCNIFVKSHQPFEDEISQIYRKYIVDVVNISVDIENNIVMDNSQEQNIHAITFEARPLMDILPYEMSNEEKIKVVNDYYSQKLAGVEQLRTRLLAEQLEHEISELRYRD